MVSAVLRSLPGRRPQQPDNRKDARSSRGEEMVKDPQCGTFVPRGEAVEGSKRGKTHYFCSRECRDAYLHGH
jgi:YHS domain-containing protein